MNRKIYSSLLLLSSFVSCDKFEEINTNPLAVSQEMGKMDGIAIGANIQSMQANVFTVGIPADGTDVVNKYQTAYHLAADTWSGYFAQNADWNAGSNNTTYFLIEGWCKSSYAQSYSSILPLWSSIKAESEKSNFPEAFALAQILKVATWHKATDMFGPIPYKEAGKGLFVVPYDSQEDVYQYFFDDLTNAIAVLTPKAQQGVKVLPKYDVIYQGDTSKWVKFANSLMLRLAMRIRYADANKARIYAEQAVNHSLGLITSIADEAKIDKFGSLTFVNNIETFINQYAECRMGSPMFSYLVGYQDPRLMAYFEPTTSGYGEPVAFAGGELYQGIPSGLGMADSEFVKFSKPKIQKSTPTYWLRASEVAFLKAEGALIGWNMGGTAEDFYKQGIQISFSENGIDPSGVTEYLTKKKPPVNHDVVFAPSVAPTNATTEWIAAQSNERKLEKIITQKWIALFPNGQEAWSEWRRTGYPKLFPIITNRSGGEISTATGVRRLKYPSSELSAEERVNLDKAIQLLGGPNTGGTKVWWDKK